MSAIVCGKRSFFEDLPINPISKRIRSSSSSPSRFSLQFPFLIDHLVAIFPDMENQVIERALDECGDDLDSAIKSLYELRLGSADANLRSMDGIASDGAIINGEVPSSENGPAPKSFPMDRGDWVELFVREMASASDMVDARSRASRALGALEKSILAHTCSESSQSLSQENIMLREQVEALIQENIILKRAVSIQHERQREFEDKNQEVQHLKQMASQYQERLRTLEVNNYALTMHLKQAQQSNSIPGRFHPDVF